MRKKIDGLLKFLEKAGVLDSVWKVPQYNDDPKIFQFASKLRYKKRLTSGVRFDGIVCGGKSFFSRELALLKCLSEVAERFCLTTYKNESVLYSNFSDIKYGAVDPKWYCRDDDIQNKKFGWILGYDLLSNKKSYLPAQLIFINYKRERWEPEFNFPNTSTGAAGEFTKEAALLNAIYEVVERDTFMNMYLAKVGASRVNLNLLKDDNLLAILDLCDRYNLELFVFDITNDLAIPTFLSLVVDRTGIGPALTVGVKTSFDIISAIVGAVEESFAARSGVRSAMNGQNLKGHLREYREVIARGLLWSGTEALKNLDFLIEGKRGKSISYEEGKLKRGSGFELKKVVNTLARKGLDIFYCDICPEELKAAGYFAYKVLIPGLQPLFLDEDDRGDINIARLGAVAGHFKIKTFEINNVPHPFL